MEPTPTNVVAGVAIALIGAVGGSWNTGRRASGVADKAQADTIEMLRGEIVRLDQRLEVTNARSEACEKDRAADRAGAALERERDRSTIEALRHELGGLRLVVERNAQQLAHLDRRHDPAPVGPDPVAEPATDARAD